MSSSTARKLICHHEAMLELDQPTLSVVACPDCDEVFTRGELYAIQAVRGQSLREPLPYVHPQVAFRAVKPPTLG